MFVRAILCAFVVLLVTAAHGMTVAAPAASALTTDFDQEDFAGLVILHVHTDGQLHLHVHLFGTQSVFLPSAFPPSPSPSGAVAAYPGKQAMAPLELLPWTDPLAAALLIIATIPYRRSSSRRPTAPRAISSPNFAPPDPPPQFSW